MVTLAINNISTARNVNTSPKAQRMVLYVYSVSPRININLKFYRKSPQWVWLGMRLMDGLSHI